VQYVNNATADYYCCFCTFIQAAVSVKRIENFLLQEDVDPDNVQTDPNIGEVLQLYSFLSYHGVPK